MFYLLQKLQIIFYNFNLNFPPIFTFKVNAI